MSTAAPATIRSPIVLRNSPILLGLRYLSACLWCVFGVCFGLIALKPFAHRDFLNGLVWTGSGVLFLSAGLALWSATRKMARNTVRLTAEGVCFQFHSQANQPDVFLALPDITKVGVKRLNKVQVCSVFATGDRVVQFSSRYFVRPKQVARTIAEHAGHTLA